MGVLYCLLTFLGLAMRKWLLCPLARISFPVPVMVNRLAAVLRVFILGIRLLRDGWLGYTRKLGRFFPCRGGGKDHNKAPALLSRRFFQQGLVLNLRRETFQQAHTKLGMSDFAPSKVDCYLNFVPILQKFLDETYFKLNVVLVDAGAHADLADLHPALVFPCLPLFFRLLIFELAVVENTTNRRLRCRRNFN